MAEIECRKCGSSRKYGKRVYMCPSCDYALCHEHGRAGERCPKCGKGYLEEIG